MSADAIARWREHPAQFVREVFGVTPDAWQDELLEAFPSNRRIAMKACKGPGKTALEAWLAWNFLLTRPHPKVAATSITADNLADNLWSEMAKWQDRSPLLKATFEWQKTRIFAKDHPETWWMSARSWPKGGSSQDQANTLAGLHADYILFILDESGGMPDAVMASAEAALSSCIEGHIVQAGNPTNLEGPLYRASTSERHLWHVVEITADPDDPKRTPRVSVQWAREQIEKYGRDNPFVRVNVFGEFPPASLNVLVGPDEIKAASLRSYRPGDYFHAPRILGCDVARFGDDASVIWPRQGLLAMIPERHRNLDGMQGAGIVARKINDWEVDAVFIDDTGGYGSSWMDNLRRLGHAPIGVAFSSSPADARYLNKRAEMYFAAVQWIKDGGQLPPLDKPGMGAREKQLGRLFSMLDGRANMPENQLASQIASDIRTVKSMASLGAVAITHFSAAVTKAAELRYQGVGFLERYGDFMSSIVKGRGRGQERELADLMLAGTEGMHGRILDRFQPDDTVPGTLSKIANRFFSATGLTYLLDAQKAGAMRVMSRHLGRLVDTEHGALPPEVRRGLLQYGITPKDWEALRTAPDHTTMDDGRVFLTPDAARRSTADLTDKQRDALALKLHAYFSDVADRSIVTPGIADRYLLTGGTAPGTALGEAMRFVAQFKTWGVAAARQGFGRELYGGQGVAGAASGVFQMAAGAAAMGYLVMTLKGLTNGQEPRPPNSVATWTAAMIQGGGFGILGDYLFGEYNRFGGGFGESLLGPVLGQGASDIINIWNDIKNAPDDAKGRTLRDLGGDTLKIAQGWTPFVNLFYTRALVNYLFVNELQEAMNPGYLRRHEQIVKRLNGTDYWLSPSRVHQQGLPAALGVGR